MEHVYDDVSIKSKFCQIQQDKKKREIIMEISILLMKQIAELFLMILMGYIVVKAGLLKGDDSKVISKIVLYLIIPCVIINAFQVDYTSEKIKELLLVFAASVLLQVVLLAAVPGKGNFFLEELAKVGAGTKKQIFGQIGLDHGPEWYSAKITNLSARMPQDSDFAKRVIQYSITADTTELGKLTVQSAAGSTAGTTKLSVTPALTSGNSYKYKVSDEEIGVEAGQNVRVWKSWDGKSDIEAESGKHITIAECGKNYEIEKAGSATVTAKTE